MPILQWFLLFLLSLLISLIFLYLHLPAAMLLDYNDCGYRVEFAR